MKKLHIAAVMLMTSLFLTAAAVNAEDISIVVNGSKIDTETPPVIVEGNTLVPLRAVTEALGCDVFWDSETQGITLTEGENLYFTWIGRDCAFKTSAVAIEGTSVMEVSPRLMDGYTMVPLRAISELFGAEVGWDGNTSTVTVNYEQKKVEEGTAERFLTYEKGFDNMYDAYKGFAVGGGNTVKADIQLENGGVIGLELYPDIAPVTVANFVKLANENFYDGLVFHRVIKDFMIQGGGFDTDMKQKETDTIKGEFIVNGVFNMIPHERGVISMARTSVMDSASSQFFIMHANSPSLNGQYAAFGKVTSGMEYVDAIANTATETKTVDGQKMDDVPSENKIIKTVVIK